MAVVAGVRAQNTASLSPQDAALLALAREAVRGAVTGSSPIALPVAALGDLPSQGVFVTIERNGNVVGCRGTLQPRFANLRTEVQTAARSAATTDPRYRPLTPPDLSRFLVTVTVIERLEPIGRAEALTLTSADGIALQAGNNTGVVLPYEGRDPATRLRWAYQKAGVPNNSSCRLWRVVARRFRG
ncbi:MAG: AMMECR1 domain-containing protein [Fibrella sp.]|nr:AMMECR1 domain-containing protein [Armatimonadota bacterium]